MQYIKLYNSYKLLITYIFLIESVFRLFLSNLLFSLVALIFYLNGYLDFLLPFQISLFTLSLLLILFIYNIYLKVLNMGFYRFKLPKSQIFYLYRYFRWIFHFIRFIYMNFCLIYLFFILFCISIYIIIISYFILILIFNNNLYIIYILYFLLVMSWFFFIHIKSDNFLLYGAINLPLLLLNGNNITPGNTTGRTRHASLSNTPVRLEPLHLEDIPLLNRYNRIYELSDENDVWAENVLSSSSSSISSSSDLYLDYFSSFILWVQ